MEPEVVKLVAFVVMMAGLVVAAVLVGKTLAFYRRIEAQLNAMEMFISRQFADCSALMVEFNRRSEAGVAAMEARMTERAAEEAHT